MIQILDKRKAGLRLGAMLVAISLVLVFATVAGAVHNEGIFELETNAQGGANATTENTDEDALPDDWDRVEAGTDHATGGSAFNDDPANTTTFTGGGSKDDQDLSDWKWKNGSAPDKDELLHGFAARYDTLASRFLFFGADRFDNSGDAQIGFWFLQDDIAANGTPGGSGLKFASDDGVAEHVVGDLLILSDFTGGGTDSHIRVFMWDPSFPGAVDGVLRPLGGSASVSATCGVNDTDPFCANVNKPTGTNLTDAPWDFLDKSGHTDFAIGELYEGGVDLKRLPVDLSGLCFASFLVETRSSSSVDAVLKDFILDSFQPCQSGIVTTPTNAVVDAGSTNTDSAVVTGIGGGTPTGTVTFFICSPSETDKTDPLNPTCPDPNGTQVGSPVPLDPDLNNPNQATAVSAPTIALNTPGTWCFRGVYNGGGPYDPATDDSTTECFTVRTIPTTTTTAQSWTPNDSATITTNGPSGYNLTGSVAFSLFNNATCSGTALYAQTVNIPANEGLSATVGTTNGNGIDGGDEAPTDAVITVSGTYSWLVVYTPAASDVAHTGSTSVCHDEHTALTITNDDPTLP